MARGIFSKLNRCHFCGRPGFIRWDRDLCSCGHEVCESLAFAEVRRRHGKLVDDKAAHEIDEYEREQTAHVLSELHEPERRYPPPPSTPRPRRPTLA